MTQECQSAHVALELCSFYINCIFRIQWQGRPEAEFDILKDKVKRLFKSSINRARQGLNWSSYL